MGACNRPTSILYLRHYPICEKHWDADCDRKFKYKHFENLRDYLGYPPTSKPAGYEHLDEDYFSHSMEISIDVEQNVPVLMEERLVLWDPSVQTERPKSQLVRWNGAKEDPLELYTNVGDKRIILLIATGVAVKFSSEQAINAAIEKLQDVINGVQPENWEIRIAKKFKKSKFWQVKEGCGEAAKVANA